MKSKGEDDDGDDIGGKVKMLITIMMTIRRGKSKKRGGRYKAPYLDF